MRTSTEVRRPGALPNSRRAGKTQADRSIRPPRSMAGLALNAAIAAWALQGWFVGGPLGLLFWGYLAALVVARLVVARVQARPVLRVLIVGTDAAARKLARDIAQHPDARIEVVGLVGDAAATGWPVDGEDGPILGPTASLPLVAESHRPDAIVVPSLGDAPGRELVECLGNGVKLTTFPRLYEQLEGRIPVPCLDFSWFVHEVMGRERRGYGGAKRALDVAVALVGLFATGLLLPFIALAIRAGGGPGSIFYAQDRVGLRGRSFAMYKFRSMRNDAEKDGARWAQTDDPRVTTVGRMLRRSRLDELPQFWNVLKGDMSVVGPRPERPEFVAQLALPIPFYHQRHAVLPGVTGWAQVKYPYGASVEDAVQKHQYDLYYLKNRSLWLDLVIMAKTFGVMVNKIGSR